MRVRTPAEMDAAFGAAVNSGAVENLIALCEPEALLAPEPGKRRVGTPRPALRSRHLLALGGTMESPNNYCMEVGDLAPLQDEWTLTGEAPGGEPVEVTLRTAEIVRRQADGSWLYVVDHAFADD